MGHKDIKKIKIHEAESTTFFRVAVNAIIGAEKITKAELGKRSGIPPQKISDYLNHRINFSEKRRIEIAKALNRDYLNLINLGFDLIKHWDQYFIKMIHHWQNEMGSITVFSSLLNLHPTQIEETLKGERPLCYNEEKTIANHFNNTPEGVAYLGKQKIETEIKDPSIAKHKKDDSIYNSAGKRGIEKDLCDIVTSFKNQGIALLINKTLLEIEKEDQILFIKIAAKINEYIKEERALGDTHTEIALETKHQFSEKKKPAANGSD